MEHKTKRVSAAATMLILAALACQRGPAPAPTFIVTVKPVSPPTSTLPFQTATPVVFDVAALATFTPEATGLPTFPPTDTLIPSPTIPLVSVSVATNCRTGPAQVYDRVAVLDVGIAVQIVGKYTPDNYWIVLMPNGSQCWLWGQYASTAGNIGSLPEMVPPPRPTAPPVPTAAVGAVTGEIMGVEGAKISGALVTAQLSRQTYTTNSDGTYLIGNLPAGREFISIEDGVHKPKFQSVNISAGTTVTANFLLEFNQFDKLVGTAEGLVLYNSQPAAGVNVSLWGKNASGVTDNNGRYRIEFVDEGYKQGDTLLILAELGNVRGGVEWDPSQPGGVPDIIVLPR